MIIEDEPELNGQNEEFDENLNTQNLIEKYLFKYACLNTLLSVVDRINIFLIIHIICLCYKNYYNEDV